MPISELGEINWKNPDVNKLFEILSKQFDKKDQKMKRLEEENRQMKETIDKLTKTIEELKRKRADPKTCAATTHESSRGTRMCKNPARPRNMHSRTTRQYPEP